MPPPTRPRFTFVFGGPSARIESGSITWSMDSISASAQCKFPGDPRTTSTLFPAVDVNQLCQIYGGLATGAGAVLSNYLLFAGYIEDDGSSYGGTSLENTLSL